MHSVLGCGSVRCGLLRLSILVALGAPRIDSILSENVKKIYTWYLIELCIVRAVGMDKKRWMDNWGMTRRTRDIVYPHRGVIMMGGTLQCG